MDEFCFICIPEFQPKWCTSFHTFWRGNSINLRHVAPSNGAIALLVGPFPPRPLQQAPPPPRWCSKNQCCHFCPWNCCLYDPQNHVRLYGILNQKVVSKTIRLPFLQILLIGNIIQSHSPKLEPIRKRGKYFRLHIFANTFGFWNHNKRVPNCASFSMQRVVQNANTRCCCTEWGSVFLPSLAALAPLWPWFSQKRGARKKPCIWDYCFV